MINYWFSGSFSSLRITAREYSEFALPVKIRIGHIEMTEAKFILVRHGETKWNTERKWQGHKNSPLTPNGIDQAKAVASRLKKMPFSILYSSPLGRAMQTAEIITDATGHEIVKVPGITERSTGVFEGLSIDEIKANYPQELHEFDNSGPDYAPPGGESARQHEQRVMACMNELALKHLGDQVLVVTHGGVLILLFRSVLGIGLLTPRNFKIMNTSINVFAFTDNRWELHTWGDISHLDQLKSLDEV